MSIVKFKNMKLLITIAFTLSCLQVLGQFVTTDSAVSLGGGFYRLTKPANNELGYMWHQLAYDFSTDFMVQGKMYFGTDIHGADGITFVMQSNCAGASGTAAGGGIGYYQMPGNSIGVEFDTYQNISGTGNQDNADPAFDHIAVEKMGNVNHADLANTLVAPVQMSSTTTQVKDGNWHDFKITYNVSTHVLEVYFDNVLRVSFTYDIVANIFGGNPLAYWGFSSSTGGQNNLQEVYINKSITKSPLRDTTICTGSVSYQLPALTQFAGRNLAIGKPAMASSVESPAYPASAAFDNDMTSRWSSVFSDPQWIRVDLGGTFDIDSVVLYWEASYADQYRIEYTADTNSTWTTAFSTTTGDGGKDVIIAPGTNVRYVRMYGTHRALSYGYSLFEFQVYGKGKYVWSPNNGTISPNIYTASPTFSPTVTTTYKVSIPDLCAGNLVDSFTVTVNCVMPVTFILFEVTKNNSVKELHWQTTDEVNTNHYIVERSDDGIHFYPIGKVQANNTAGIQNYYWNDYASISYIAYYRIAELDLNGDHTYSSIKSISDRTDEIQILPNPTEGQLVVKGLFSKDEQVQIRIVNSLGQVIIKEDVIPNSLLEIILNLSGFAPGIYVLNLNASSINCSQKIIKK
jgi:hypothetical protein